MNININGVPREIQKELSVMDLIDLLELRGKRVAVEINQQLVPRSRFLDHYVHEQDQIEIIHAVGGG